MRPVLVLPEDLVLHLEATSPWAAEPPPLLPRSRPALFAPVSRAAEGAGHHRRSRKTLRRIAARSAAPAGLSSWRRRPAGRGSPRRCARHSDAAVSSAWATIGSDAPAPSRCRGAPSPSACSSRRSSAPRSGRASRRSAPLRRRRAHPHPDAGRSLRRHRLGPGAQNLARPQPHGSAHLHLRHHHPAREYRHVRDPRHRCRAWEYNARDAGFDQVAMVDVQPSFLEERFVEVDLVIDHHPVEPRARAGIRDVRPSYGATSTILVEYICGPRTSRSRSAWRRRILSGIKADTLDSSGAARTPTSTRSRSSPPRQPQRAGPHRRPPSARPRSTPPGGRPRQARDRQGRVLHLALRPPPRT